MQQQKPVKQPEVKAANRQAQTPSIQQLGVKRATPTPPPPTPPNLQHAGIQRRPADPRTLTPALVMHLQGTIGNHAVQRLLNQPNQQNSDVSRPPTSVIQPKLKVGAARDHFEEEADQVARQVVQKKSVIQRASKNWSGEGFETSPAFEKQLSHSKGKGRPLPPKTRNEFESSFGDSFDNVRIHTGADAKQLNRSIQAKAFTHGNDIHFGAGEYNANSSQGKQLLAHELTHTIQQSGRKPLQRQPGVALQKRANPQGFTRAPTPDPTPAIQRKFTFQSAHLGEVSFSASISKATGDESTLSLLKKAIDDYHEQFPYSSLEEQLDLLEGIHMHAYAWVKKHVTPDNQHKSKKLRINAVYKAVCQEILAVKKEITDEPETQQAYLNKVEGGNFKYLSEEGQALSQDMKLWNQGQESPRAEVNAEKYANRAQPFAKVTSGNKVTQAEATAIGIYTASDYRYMNPAWSDNAGWMKKSLPRVTFAKNQTKGDVTVNEVTDEQVEESTKEGKEHGKIALSGLKKLPDWKGKVYRGEGWTNEQFAERYGKSKSGTFPAFISTGENIDAANSFLFDSDGDKLVLVRLTIMVTRGKNVADISNAPKEKEILLLPGATYKVSKLRKTPYQEHKIGMKHDVMDVELIQTS